MPSTDTRIVQMQFDNKDFEKNIAVSQESLEKFKEELDFDEQEKNLRDFGDATKRISFDSMAENLQRLADKFTGLGTISELVLSQIRRGIESAARSVSNFVDSMTTQQISAGEQKFEMLNKSVQTIKAATGRSEEDVYAVMKRLNQYTDQTSYNFADMAQNIGKFTSVGIPLEQAERQMEGIANWAARSGAGINEASRAMYNLSQAMGVGQLKLMDWKSIENAGMATKEFKEQLIEAGIAAGTLERDAKTGVVKTAKSLGKQVEVSYTNLSETLSKGWATKAVLGNTLERYYYGDLYYEEEEKALIELSEAQQEAIDKMEVKNDKLDSSNYKVLENLGLMTDENKKKLFELAVAQGRLVKTTDKNGKVIYQAVDKNGKKVEVSLDKFSESLKTGWLSKQLLKDATSVNELAKASYEAAQKCLTFSDVIGAWKDQISTGWMNSFQHIFGNLSESMELFSTICNKVGEAFDGLISRRNDILEIWATSEHLSGRGGLWGLIIGQYGDGEDAMYEGAYGLLDVILEVGELIKNGFWDMIYNLLPEDALTGMLGQFFPDFEGTFKDLWDSEEFGDTAKSSVIAVVLDHIISKIREFITTIRDFFNEIPEGASKSRLEMISDIVSGIFNAAALVYIVFKEIVKFFDGVREKLQPSIDKILGLLSRLGIGVKDTAHDAATGTGLTDFFNGLLDAITPLTDAINLIIGVIADLITQMIDGGTESGAFGNALKTIGDVLTKIVNIVAKLIGPAVTFISDLINAFSILFNEGISEESMKKVGAALEAAFNNLFNGIFGVFGDKLGEKIQNFIAYIFGFAEEETTDAAEGEAKTIVGVIKQWLRKIFGIFGGLFDGLKNEEGEFTLFRLLKENLGFGLLGKFLNGIGQVLRGANLYQILTLIGVLYLIFKAIIAFKNMGGAFKQVKGFFGGLSDSLKNGFKLDVSDKTESFGEKFLQIAKGIALIAAAIAVLGSMKLSALAKGVVAVAAILGMMGLFIYVMKKQIQGMGLAEIVGLVAAIGLTGLAISAIAISVGILLLMLKPLAKMNFDQIMNMLIGLAGVMGILFIFCKLVSTENVGVKPKDMIALGILALAVGILIKSLLPLQKVSFDGILNMMIALGLILGELFLFAKLMGSATFKDKGLWGLIGLAAGIAILILSLRSLTTITDPMDFVKMFGSLAVILFELAIFSKLMGTFKGTGMGKTILLAAGIALLLEAIKPLAAFSWESLGKMATGLAGVLAMLAIFSRTMGTFKGKGMFGVLLLCTSILILFEALKPLANFEWDELLKMGVGLLAVLAIIAVFLHVIPTMGLRQGIANFASLIALAAVIGVFGLAMSAAKDLTWDQMLVMCLGLAAVLIVFAAVVDTINNNSNAVMKGTHALVAMVGLAAVMLIFSIAMNEIKNVKTDKILAFSLGLAALIAAVGIALKMTQGMSIGAALKGILIISVAVAALMGVLALMMPILVGAIASSLETMSAKLSLIASMFSIFVQKMSSVSEEEVEGAKRKFEIFLEIIFSMKDVSSYYDAIDDFSYCLLLLASGVAIFTELTKNTPDPETNPAIQLIEKVLSLKDDIAAFSIGTFATGMQDLGSAAANFTASSSSVTDANPPALSLMESILKKKKDISEFSIGSFATSAQSLGSGLAGFVTNSVGVTTSEPESWKLLKKFLDNTSAIQTFGNTDFGKATETLQGLGGALAIFAQGANAAGDISGGVDQTKVNSALEIMDMITTGINEKGGFVIPELPSEDEIGTFPSQLAALAIALVDFTNACVDFDNSNTSKAIDALKFLGQLNTNLTADDLKVANRFTEAGIGETVMGQFSLDIRSLGSALHDFWDATKDFGDTANTVKCLDFLKTLKEKLTANRIKVAKVFGDAGVDDTILGQFALDITSLGGALYNFWNETKDISDTKTAFDALDFLAGLKERLTADNIKAIKAFKDANVHEDALKEFALDITALGGALATFANETHFEEGVKETFDAAIASLDGLVDLQNRMPKVGGIKQFIEGYNQDLGSLADDLVKLGPGMADFARAVTENVNFGDENITAAMHNGLTIINDLVTILSQMGRLGEVFKWGNTSDLQYYTTYYTSMIRLFMQTLTQEIPGLTDQFGQTVGPLGNNLAKIITDFDTALDIKGGLKNADSAQIMSDLTTSLVNLANAAATMQGEGGDTSFEPVGLNIALGVANGILSPDADEAVCNAARTMIQRIKAAAENEATIQSPSVLFAEGVGKYLALGVAQGITDHTDAPEKAAEGLVDDTLNGAESPLAKLSQLLSEGIDTNPTITPVIDLTKVNEGLTAMDGLFGGYGIDPSIAARYADTSVPREATEVPQMPDLSWLQDTITSIGEKVENLGAQVQGMKVVMDSGALVGSISPLIDAKFGRDSFYAGRRN